MWARHWKEAGRGTEALKGFLEPSCLMVPLGILW